MVVPGVVGIKSGVRKKDQSHFQSTESCDAIVV